MTPAEKYFEKQDNRCPDCSEKAVVWIFIPDRDKVFVKCKKCSTDEPIHVQVYFLDENGIILDPFKQEIEI